VWDSLEQVWGMECAAGSFVKCVSACAACGTVWSRFGGVSVQQVALRCVCVCVCLCVCCVWNSLEQVWGMECAAGSFVVCVSVCDACGTVCSRFGVVSVQQVALWCVCVCVCLCECAACGTVWSRFEGVSVEQVALWCVCVCVCLCDCSACGTVLSRFGGVSVQQVVLWCVCVFVCVCVSVLRVGQFGTGLGE